MIAETWGRPRQCIKMKQEVSPRRLDQSTTAYSPRWIEALLEGQLPWKRKLKVIKLLRHFCIAFGHTSRRAEFLPSTTKKRKGEYPVSLDSKGPFTEDILLYLGLPLSGKRTTKRDSWWKGPVSLTRSGYPRIIPSFHRHMIRRKDEKADRLVKLYLSIFSLSRIITLAKPVGKHTFSSIVSPPIDMVWWSWLVPSRNSSIDSSADTSPG